MLIGHHRLRGFRPLYQGADLSTTTAMGNASAGWMLIIGLVVSRRRSLVHHGSRRSQMCR